MSHHLSIPPYRLVQGSVGRPVEVQGIQRTLDASAFQPLDNDAQRHS